MYLAMKNDDEDDDDDDFPEPITHPVMFSEMKRFSKIDFSLYSEFSDDKDSEVVESDIEEETVSLERKGYCK